MLGYQAGDNITTGANNTVIGNEAAASSTTVSNEITLGNTAITKFRVPGVGFEVDGTTSADNLKFNSGYGSAATAYGCRAWVNFQGTGTVSIRGDGNVSSITDNGTGDYTVNFTTSMPDNTYAVVDSCAELGGGVGANDNGVSFQPHTYSSASIRGLTSYTDVKVDTQFVNVAIFR
jgi:hypothetical protein